ncbi:hypothetical protein HC891_24415 [Candidatus Gracilibacteria bacterium]|nr:hypothetical protein [Candidatus Gracilibacteria bacterium]
MRATFDDTGEAIATASYDHYGGMQGSAIAPFGFTGERQVGDAVYLRARWYHASEGRFATFRWRTAESVDAVPYSHHPYAYALSNPVNWTDPTGKYSSSLIEAMI